MPPGMCSESLLLHANQPLSYKHTLQYAISSSAWTNWGLEHTKPFFFSMQFGFLHLLKSLTFFRDLSLSFYSFCIYLIYSHCSLFILFLYASVSGFHFSLLVPFVCLFLHFLSKTSVISCRFYWQIFLLSIIKHCLRQVGYHVAIIGFRSTSQIPGYGNSLPKLCSPQDSFCFFLHPQGTWFSHPLLRFTSSKKSSPKPVLLQKLSNRWHWHFLFQFPCTEMIQQGRQSQGCGSSCSTQGNMREE